VKIAIGRGNHPHVAAQHLSSAEIVDFTTFLSVSTDRRFTGEKRDFSTIRAASTTDLIGRSGTGACRVTAFAIELFDCQFQKRFRQATDS
jgi:hypothetical protein